MAKGLVNRGVWRVGPLLAALFLLPPPAAAQQASEAQRNAIRQACPADYQAHCANVAAGGQAAFSCLARNLAQLSPACQRAVAAVSGGVSSRATASSAAPAPSAAPYAGAAAVAPMTPRQKLMVLRQSCGGDFYAFCRGVPFGGGRAIACLRAHAGSLSPQCGEALSAARGNR